MSYNKEKDPIMASNISYNEIEYYYWTKYSDGISAFKLMYVLKFKAFIN